MINSPEMPVLLGALAGMMLLMESPAPPIRALAAVVVIIAACRMAREGRSP